MPAKIKDLFRFLPHNYLLFSILRNEEMISSLSTKDRRSSERSKINLASIVGQCLRSVQPHELVLPQTEHVDGVVDVGNAMRVVLDDILEIVCLLFHLLFFH